MSLKRLSGLVAPALLAGLLAGCAADSTSTPGSEGIDVEALPPLALTEEVRIGSATDSAMGFRRIGGVQVGPDGTVYVLDSATRQVRIYDAQGTLIRRLGGPGSGAGEFASSPTGFQLVGDTLAVFETLRESRITFFDGKGEVRSTVSGQSVEVPFPAPNLRVYVRASRLRRDGLFDGNVIYSMSPNPTGEAPPAMPDSVMVPRVVFDGTGAPVDTLYTYPYRFPASTLIGTLAVNRAPGLPVNDLRVAVTRDLGSAGESDTVLVTRPVASSASMGMFTVTRVRESGDTVYQQLMRYRPRRLSAAYRDSVLESRLAPYEEAQQPVDMAAIRRGVEAALAWPDFHPPVVSLLMGNDGSPWIRREAGGERVRWTVLHADGSPRGELATPPRLNIQWIDGDRIWVMERDARDVLWVVRYRITGG